MVDIVAKITGFGFRTGWRRRLLYLFLPLLCGLFASGLYHRAVKGQFAWDDPVLIINNDKNLDEWGDALGTFARPAVGKKNVSYYRPILIVSYIIDRQVGGKGNASFFHRTNVILHGINTVMVWILLSTLCGSTLAATLGALLFCAHPIHGQAVSLLTGRNDMLLLVPFLGGILLYRAWDRDAGLRRTALHVAIALMYALVLWTKETGIVLPAVFLAYDLLLSGRSLRDQGNRSYILSRAPIMASLALVTVLYFVTRYAVFGYFLSGGIYGSPPWSERLLDAVATFGYYIQKTLLPYGLAPYPHISRMSNPATNDFLLALFFIGLFFWGLFRSWRSRPLAAFGLLTFAICILPVIGFVPMKLPILENRTYAAFFGIALAVSSLVVKRDTAGWKRFVPAILLTIIVAAFSFMSYSRVPHFRNPLTLWAHAVVQVPDSAWAHEDYGHALLNANQLKEALPHIREALRIDPDRRLAGYDLAVCFEKLGRREQAILQLEQYLRRRPGHIKARHALGILYKRKGELEKAEAAFKQGLKRHPREPLLLGALGDVLEGLKRPEEAAKVFELLCRIEPENASNWEAFGRSLHNAKRYQEALSPLEKALAIGPETAQRRFSLGYALFMAGRPKEALPHALRARDMGYKDPRLMRKLNEAGFGLEK